jgi:hypothetical protein
MIFSFVDIVQGRVVEIWKHFNKRCFRTEEKGEQKAGNRSFISAEFF